MTDNDIKKALECCIADNASRCSECAYIGTVGCCFKKMMPDALDLINRQQAEIERLQIEIYSLKIANEHLYHITQEHNAECEMLDGNISHWKNLYLNEEHKNNTAKIEAIKEFAKRLKAIVSRQSSMDFEDVDDLVAEMTKEVLNDA